MSLVLGDFSAEVGTDSNLWARVLGPLVIDCSNGNGEHLLQMEPHIFLSKDNYENVLHQALHERIRAELGDAIVENIKNLFDNGGDLSCESTVDNISKDIATSESFTKLQNSFIQDIVNTLKECSEQECDVVKDDKWDDLKAFQHNYGSITSSLSSSLNHSSVVFLTAEQLHETAQMLLSSSPLPRLEALQTLSRISSLEQLLTQSLWPEIEIGLHNSLASNVHFIREGSLKIYTKMLASPLPQVVRESYHSLIKCVSSSFLPKARKRGYDRKLTLNTKVTAHLIIVINRFQQHISAHWLRYPQSIIEDIIHSSVSLLAAGSNTANDFPVWKYIALSDQEAKWLKNFMYGNVSRSLVLMAFSKHPYVLRYCVRFCEKFCSDPLTKHFALGGKGENICCINNQCLNQITHIICFLSHLLCYSEGRHMLNSFYADVTGKGWIYILKLIMQCTWKLCDAGCFKCCLPASDTIAGTFKSIWKFEPVREYDNQKELLEILIIPLTFFKTSKNLFYGNICLVAQCLCEVIATPLGAHCLTKNQIKGQSICSVILQYFTELTCSASVSSKEQPIASKRMLYFSLKLIRKLITLPFSVSWLMNPDLILVLVQWAKKFNDNFKNLSSVQCDVDVPEKNLNNFEFQTVEQEIMAIYFDFLKKPICFMISCKAGLFNYSLNLYLDKLQNNECGSLGCLCDITALSTILCHSLKVSTFLDQEQICRISSVVWQHNLKSIYDINEGLTKSKIIIQPLVYSLSYKLFYLETACDKFSVFKYPFIDYVLLFPNITRDVYFLQNDANIIGLHIISVLVCCIKTFCILQAKFHLQETLLESQSEFLLCDGRHIIDCTLVLQNHILAKTFAIGGPTERNLPPLMLSEVQQHYNWPIITSYPIPDLYFFPQNYEDEDSLETSALFTEDLISVQNAIKKQLNLHKVLKRNTVTELLKESMKYITVDADIASTLNEADLCSTDELLLYEEEKVGITLAIRYGTFLNLFSDDFEYSLSCIMKSCKSLFGIEDSTSFDAFPATVYLMMKGDLNTVWLFLEKFAKSRNSLFIWLERLEQITQQNKILSFTKGVVMEYIDIIVREKLPSVFSVFQLSGVTPSLMFNYWVDQCFWNYLDWTEICHFVVLTIFFGGDYAIYFFVAILKHLNSTIVRHAHSHDIICQLKENAITEYRTINYMEFILDLANQYHESIDLLLNQCINCNSQEL